MGARIGARLASLGALAVLALRAGTAAGQQPGPAPPQAPAVQPAASAIPPAAAVPPSVSAPAALAPPSAAAPTPPAVAEGAPPLPPPGGEAPAPIPTADERPAASDHDAVVGHYGIQARRVDPGPLPLALRPGLGCAADASTPCTVTLGALGARYWMTRNLAWNGYLALGAGGGSLGAQGLDSYFAAGPILGLTLLLGNWRHLAIGASPELAVIWFRPGGAGGVNTTLVQMRAALEAELHFGFVGVPALSVGLVAGAELGYESAPDAHLWSVGMIGAGSVWGTLTDLFIRYYL